MHRALINLVEWYARASPKHQPLHIVCAMVSIGSLTLRRTTQRLNSRMVWYDITVVVKILFISDH